MESGLASDGRCGISVSGGGVSDCHMSHMALALTAVLEALFPKPVGQAIRVARAEQVVLNLSSVVV